MSEDLDDTGSVFDLNEVPETELLDSSIQKCRAQLSIKARRPRPSTSRYRDSMSSTEGDDSMERKVCHSSVDEGASLAAPQRGRYHQLTNATSQEALVTPSSSPSRYCPSSDCSRVYMRRSRRPDSEVLVSDSSQDTSPADADSSTVVFDKKTKRRFLDLGVTLRRSYIRVRKDKSNKLSVGSRETSESPPRSSGSFVPFSWFTEGRGSPSSFGTPPPSPKVSMTTRPLSPRRSHSQVLNYIPRVPPRYETTSPMSRSQVLNYIPESLPGTKLHPRVPPRSQLSVKSSLRLLTTPPLPALLLTPPPPPDPPTRTTHCLSPLTSPLRSRPVQRCRGRPSRCVTGFKNSTWSDMSKNSGQETLMEKSCYRWTATS
ncbi:sterile alpha motif domain-containing protein 14 isoform 2-T2 [Spinachia spinachia]